MSAATGNVVLSEACILARALGPRFAELHPRIQAQYALTSRAHKTWLGRGVMEHITPGHIHVRPFLALGAMRRIMFPETGRDVPFTIANYAYVDRFGRETLTWTREFELPRRRPGDPPRRRRFDETLIYSERKQRLIVYAGTHQHLAVDLHASVGAGGALWFRTGGQRLFAGPFVLPFPLLLSGVADVCESYSDQRGRFEIDVRISNRVFGTIFGYRGWFHLASHDCPPERVPADVRPVWEQRRE